MALLSRQAAHSRALAAVHHVGLARGHHANPAASLRVEKLYGALVLLSGLASLILSRTELASLDHHHKQALERLSGLQYWLKTRCLDQLCINTALAPRSIFYPS